MDAIMAGLCPVENLGHAIAPVSALLDSTAVVIEGNHATLDHVVEIVESGMYYVQFVSCVNSTGNVYVNGEVVRMNPYCYLPGEKFAFLPLFSWLRVGHAIVAVVWGVLCFTRKQNHSYLQRCTTVVILLGLLNAVVSRWDCLIFNTTGTSSTPHTIVAFVFSSANFALVGQLIYIALFAYFRRAPMHPTLTPSEAKTLTNFWIATFVPSAIDWCFSHNPNPTLFIVVARSICWVVSVGFMYMNYLWIGRLLTLRAIESPQLQTTGVQRAVARATLGAVGAVVGLCVAAMVVGQRVEVQDRWRWVWVFAGMWHLLIFFLVCMLAVLYVPRLPPSSGHVVVVSVTPLPDQSVVAVVVEARSRDVEDGPAQKST